MMVTMDDDKYNKDKYKIIDCFPDPWDIEVPGHVPGIEDILDDLRRRKNKSGKPQDHIDVGGLRISFQRTVRVPEGQMNSLPAGLGSFPVYKVNDFRDNCPSEWKDDCYFIPMYAQEAMWMNFSYSSSQPRALVVGAGNINAISGKPFKPLKGARRGKKSDLEIALEEEQNYIVAPPQPWLDGWKAEDGKVYQFVAAELGSGETVEGQITGEETIGGLQFIIYAPKRGAIVPPVNRPHEHPVGKSYWGASDLEGCFGNIKYCMSDCMGSSRGGRDAQSMGLGRGGEIEQKVYPDPYGLDVWEEQPLGVERVYIVSSEDFRAITGFAPPSTPVTREEYERLGYPWFDLWDNYLGDTTGTTDFGKLKPVTDGQKKDDIFDKLK